MPWASLNIDLIHGVAMKLGIAGNSLIAILQHKSSLFLSLVQRETQLEDLRTAERKKLESSTLIGQDQAPFDSEPHSEIRIKTVPANQNMALVKTTSNKRKKSA